MHLSKAKKQTRGHTSSALGTSCYLTDMSGDNEKYAWYSVRQVAFEFLFYCITVASFRHYNAQT